MRALLFVIVIMGCARAQTRPSPAICRDGRTESGRPDRLREQNDPRNKSSAPATLVGRVLTPDGRPVTATVLVLQRALIDTSRVASTFADSLGVFRFAAVPSGRYHIRTQRIG